MSQTIDERLVEMRFDNKEFESGVKESLATLEKLKSSLSSLDESAKSFSQLDKAASNVSLSGIAAGVEALQERFSTLGIVSMRIIQNITDSLMNMASSAVSTMSDAIISGGLKRAQNIENAHFQLQALLKDETEVQAVMDNAMASVSGTAYAYDEAAKAASQFAASGMRAGEEMENALIGITGVAAMTNSEYESISRIFTTVAGNGRLMGDQLLQLSSRGLNAAATLSDYYNDVLGFTDMTESEIRKMVSQGEISFQTFAAAMNWAFGESAFRANETFTGAMSNVRAALAKIGAEFFSPLIEQNSDLILLINAFRERINDVKSALTFDAQKSAISGLAKATGLTTENLDEFFEVIKTRGSVASEDLIELSNAGVDATKSLTDYINGVTSGTIRSSYSTRTALEELTGGLAVSEEQVHQFVEEGKIDVKAFTSAMETAYGDQRALSKMFSDSVLDMAKSMTTYLRNLDLSKPLSLVYYGVETIKNVSTGLYSVVKPIANAFSDVFSSFHIGIDDIVNLADRIESLTETMTLSEKRSQDLYDAFHGISSVVKLMIDGIIGLIKPVASISKPINSLTDVVFSLAGALGRGLTSFSEWIRNSPKIKAVYTAIADGIQKTTSWFSMFIENFDDYVNYIYRLPIVQSIINRIVNAFNNLYENGGKYLPIMVQKIKDFRETLMGVIPENVKGLFDSFSETLKTFGENLRSVRLDSVLDVIRNLFSYLQNLDLSKPLSLGIESIENKVLRLYSIIEPIANAFLDVFSSLHVGIDDVVELVTKLKNLTKAFTLTEKRSKDLYDAFHGVFSVLTLLSSVFVGLLDLANLVLNPLIDIVFSLAGALGRALTAFTEWVRTSPKAKQAFTAIGDGIRKAMIWFSGFIENIGDFVYYIRELPIVKSVINGVTDTFRNLYTNGAQNLTALIQKIKEFGGKVVDLFPGSIIRFFESFGQKVKEIGENLRNLKLPNVTNMFQGFLDKLKNILTIFTGNEGLNTFISNMKQYFSDLANAFTFENLIEKIESFKTSIGNFVSWIRDAFSFLFGNISLGGAITTAGGFGIIYSIIQVTKTFNKITAIPNVLSSIRTALSEYQTDINTNIILKIAEAIGILAVSITILSFADMNRAWQAASMLAAIGAVIMLAMNYFNQSRLTQNISNLSTALNSIGDETQRGLAGGIAAITSTLAKPLNELAKAVKWKAIGSAIKSMAIALGLVVVAIVGLAYAYSKDADNMQKAVIVVGAIAAVMVGLILVMSAFGNKLNAGMKSFGVAAFGILALSASLLVVISALKKLFKLEIPSDFGVKLGILAGLFVALGLLTLAVAGASKLASSNGFYASSGDVTTMSNSKSGSVAGSIIGVAAALYISVLALQKLFELELPNDYKEKCIILAAAFGVLAVVILALGFASYLAGGKIKAAGTLLALCITIGTIIGALAVLSLFPGEVLQDRAITLGVTLIALAIALVGAGSITNSGAWKTVLAMAVAVGSIIVALGVLSMISVEDLAKAAIALGGVLLSLAADLFAASKMTDKLSLVSILAMVAEIATITAALYILSDQPWEGMLAGAGSISAVLLAVAGAFAIMSASTIELSTIVGFLSGVLGIAVVGAVLNQAASGASWDSLLAAGASISAVLLAMAVAMAICGAVGKAFDLKVVGNGILIFDAFIADMTLLFVALGALSDNIEDFNTWIESGGEIFTSIGTFIGEFVGNILGGIGEGIANSLPSIGQSLTDFTDNASGFFDAVSNISDDVVTGTKNLLEIIMMMTAADLLTGITSFVSLFTGGQTSLDTFGNDLKSLGAGIAGFAGIVSSINQDSLTAATNAAKTLVELQNGLDNSGGLISLFTGDNDFKTFGANLRSLGAAIVDFGVKVKDADTVRISLVIGEVEQLVDLADSLSGLDTSGMTGFGTALKAMGLNGINEFIQAFEDCTTDVETAITGMFTTVETQITTSGPTVVDTAKTAGEDITTAFGTGLLEKATNPLTNITSLCTAIVTQLGILLPDETFTTIGQGIITSLDDGIVEKQTDPLLSITTLCTAIVSQTKWSLPSETFSSIGRTVVLAISNGIAGKKSIVVASATSAAQSVTQTFRTNLSQAVFYEIGVYAMEGLRTGIISRTNAVRDSAVAAANTAINATKSALEVRSPSKVFYGIGSYVSIGLAKGISDLSSMVSSAAYGLSDDAVNPVQTAIEKLSSLINDGDMDYEPVIRPVLDLSTAEEGLDSISSMFNTLNAGSTSRLANIVSLGFGARERSTKEASVNRMEDKLDRLLNGQNQEAKTENYNTFYIQSTDPKEAADEISYIMQHKVERGKAVWER